MLKIIDGFGPHTSSPEAMQIYRDHKILLVKEEGDTSHVCQAYDQDVAKKDKSAMRDALALLREKSDKFNGVVDGWDLIHAALAAVRELPADSWVTSFKRVNLHPKYRTSFVEWCKKIDRYLVGGQSFESETELDMYSLLPSFWHGMTPAEKKKAVSIFDKHGDWTVPCVREMALEMNDEMKWMQQLRVCIETAKENPQHLNMTCPASSVSSRLSAEAKEAEAAASESASQDLRTFELIPKGDDGKPALKGHDLFQHLVRFGRHRASSEVQHAPSPALQVEMTAQQLKLLNPTAEDYTISAIIRDAHGDGARAKLSKRKLDCLGEVHSSCAFANSPERIERLQKKLRLASSMAAINALSSREKEEKSRNASALLLGKAPAALAKLATKNWVVSSLTMEQISAVALRYFGAVLKPGKKAFLVTQLVSMIENQPETLRNAALSESSSSTSTVALHVASDNSESILQLSATVAEDIHDSDDEDGCLPVPDLPARSRMYVSDDES